MREKRHPRIAAFPIGEGGPRSGARVLSLIVDLRCIFSLSFIPLSPSNLRPLGAPPSGGRRENALFPATSFRAKARNLFRLRLGKGCEECGEREACFMRLGSTVFHADGFTKENGNGKRKRSLGCARDDETGEAYLTFFFNPLRNPTSAPSRHLLPEEGGRARGIGLPFLTHRLLLFGGTSSVIPSYSFRRRGGCRA